MGRVTAESSHGQVHHYEYDLAGNRVKASYSTGRIVETSYDGLNRPEAIVDGDRLTRYGYDKAGRAVILVAANGQTSSNTYDALGRLTDRVLYKTPAMDPAQRLAQFKWQHDLLGNVTQQEEIWPGETARSGDFLRTTMGYDANNRLISESIVTYYETYDEGQSTTYTYDDANNRTSKSVNGGAEPGHWDYTYNAANQLTAWEHLDYPNGSVLRSASLTYDDAGNRTSQAVTQVSGSYNPTYNPQPAVSGLTTYTWDAQDRLASVTLPGQPGTENSEPRTFTYAYDYRTRRVGTVEQTLLSAAEKRTSITFSGGLSVAEWEQESGTGFQPVLSAPPTVEYTRGPDMGGGVGGLLYTSRSESASASVSSSRTLRYNLSNGRGDIVAQSDSYAALTWTASYEAYGKRTQETGENKDKQRGNSKDEDPTGLLNEGFRYRDIETGVWLSRDPAGFVDGPNLYAYVKQNPWTGWDPHGLADKKRAYQGSQQLRGEQPIRAKGDQSDAIKLFETKTQTVGIRTDLDAVWRDVKRPMTFLGGMLPGVGEYQDAEAIVAGDSTWKDRLVATVSLTVNCLSGGTLPNFGKTTKVMTDATDAVVDTTKATITSSQKQIVNQAADAANTTPIHRVGGSDPSNLALKPQEAALQPPGISVLQGGTAGEAAAQMRAAFPNATRLHAQASTVGTSSASRIEGAGFQVMPNPTPNFPNHARITHPDGAAGFNDANLQSLSEAFDDTIGH